MNDSTTVPTNKFVKFLHKHSFALFIIVSILIASSIVFVSMELYNFSGAAQLDLSRPGYKSVQSQATNGDGDLKTFSGNGPMDQITINYFNGLYGAQVKKVKAVDAFGGDPLSPDALGFNSTN